MIRRVGENVFFDLFKSISKGKNRIPLKSALIKLNSFFNSPENIYMKNISGNTTVPFISSEEFMDEFYSRNVDKRHGLRSQILMVGGTKNIRGNPGGPMDSRLFFPQINFEQFFGIAKDMECIFLEKILPGCSGTKVNRSYKTHELKEVQKKENKRIINELKSKG